VLRMIGFYANRQRELERWKPLGVTTARIACSHSGSCDAREALDEKRYALSKLPELPYEHCTCALGCRCLYRIEFEVLYSNPFLIARRGRRSNVRSAFGPGDHPVRA